jgi:hypothetical protein
VQSQPTFKCCAYESLRVPLGGEVLHVKLLAQHSISAYWLMHSYAIALKHDSLGDRQCVCVVLMRVYVHHLQVLHVKLLARHSISIGWCHCYAIAMKHDSLGDRQRLSVVLMRVYVYHLVVKCYT